MSISISRNFGFLIGRRVVVLRSHFTSQVLRHFSTLDKNSLEQSLNEIIEYKEGTELIAKGQYDAASNRLDRVIEILELSQQQKNPIYAHLLEKSGSVLLKREGQSKRLEEISSKLSGVLQETQGKKAELATRNAFLAALNFDLKKASEHLSKLTSIPEFQLFQASLQILQGQSEPAIQTLNQFVQKLETEQQTPSKDTAELLYSALNNLGVARWQDEYPQFNHLNVVGGDNLQRKSPDFQTALLFKRALLVKNSAMKDNKIYGLFANSPDAVAPTENIPTMDFYFNEKGSDIALRAICDYLFDAHLTKRLEHTVWTKFYLKHYEMNEKQYIYRPLMSIAHHCGVSHMLLKSEGLFNTAISMLQDNKTIEKPICDYFFANTIAQIDKREEEAEQIKVAARKQIQEKFPAWGQWQLYLSLPQPRFQD